jgi:hypothetical protein
MYKHIISFKKISAIKCLALIGSKMTKRNVVEKIVDFVFANVNHSSQKEKEVFSTNIISVLKLNSKLR